MNLDETSELCLNFLPCWKFLFLCLIFASCIQKFHPKEGIGHFVCEDGFYLSTFFYQHIYFVVAKFPCLISLWF